MNGARIKIGHQIFSVTELSQKIYTGMPVYPGHPKTVVWDHLTHQETKRNGFSYAVKGLMLSDHTSTHVDSLSHIIPGDLPIADLPLDFFITPGVWVDVSHMPPRTYITDEDLKKALEDLQVDIPSRSTFLYYTGASHHWGKLKYLSEYPGLSRKAAEFLADSGCINIGCDAVSIDNPQDSLYPAHTVCKERKILNSENFVNIEKISSHEFWFISLPLLITEGTGSPIRALALVVEND
ncbi:MAG: cyclase family protein [Theionarchaea archaeon]|nr:cyclase family protein [Theionarchaea archaeon]